VLGAAGDDMVAKLRTEATAQLNSCIIRLYRKLVLFVWLVWIAGRDERKPVSRFQYRSAEAELPPLKMASKWAETLQGPTVSPEIAHRFARSNRPH